MKQALTKTDFNFPGQKSVYHGKVRDVYNINSEKLVMVATDRISAFDVILPKGIPFKGQMLNQIAAKFLDATTDICPNWKLATPDPMVTVGVMCEGFPVETSAARPGALTRAVCVKSAAYVCPKE
jgi:phosphoribosylaminoimidazole-succinocarboxamide synthase